MSYNKCPRCALEVSVCGPLDSEKHGHKVCRSCADFDPFGARQLKAEVERLRAEVARVNALHSAAESQIACRNEMRARNTKLEAENAKLREHLAEELTSKFAETFGQFEVPKLKARLAWFEK